MHPPATTAFALAVFRHRLFYDDYMQGACAQTLHPQRIQTYPCPPYHFTYYPATRPVASPSFPLIPPNTHPAFCPLLSLLCFTPHPPLSLRLARLSKLSSACICPLRASAAASVSASRAFSRSAAVSKSTCGCDEHSRCARCNHFGA